MTRGAKSDEDRRSWELFRKRFVWSHFWWVAALLLGLAVARLFLMPVTTDWISGTTTLDCGYTYTADATVDRKSTRLNSSHVKISYAVFCLKKKNKPREP